MSHPISPTHGFSGKTVRIVTASVLALIESNPARKQNGLPHPRRAGGRLPPAAMLDEWLGAR
jgi:hypothetical protein